jgi:hypothetical protein
MDFYLVKEGMVENTVSVDTLADAQQLYPAHTVIARTEANSYHADGTPVNPGDALP